jgi:dihydroxyacetone kinase-like predicted kinase
MRWNQRPKVERPEFPKLVAIAATAQQIADLLPQLVESDPQAEVVDSGGRGVYVRVHNAEAEEAAKLYAEQRSFPLA